MADSVTLSHVSKRYPGHEAVRDVSLSLPEGQLMALVGHNGAGKSTLIKLMLGLIRPSDGTLRVLGEDPCSSAALKARNGVGFLPENVVFDGALTGRAILRFFAGLKGEPVAGCEELLTLVGLEAAADRKVRTYSKGMRQRLGLAQALLGNPRMLFLDEPTSGLDPAAQAHFYEIVRDLKARGASILISSHALTELEAQADLVAMMNCGHLMACAGLPELRQQAQLPTQIRVRVPDGQAPEVASRLEGTGTPVSVNGSHLELAIETERKMELLRRIGSLGGDVTDVDVQAPTLDLLYAAFCRREEGR